MRSFASTIALAIALLLTQSTRADIVTIDIGSTSLSGTALAAGTSISDASSFVLSGAFGTGVSFTLTAVSSPGNPNSQAAGVGVSGGRAASGIDNNSNNAGSTNPSGDYTESITFTISNVVGAASIEFDGFVTDFADGGEYIEYNGGAIEEVTDVFVTVSGTTLTVRAPSVNEIQDFLGNATVSDSRYVVDELRFDVTAVPEPSSMALLGLIGLVAFRRRR